MRNTGIGGLRLASRVSEVGVRTYLKMNFVVALIMCGLALILLGVGEIFPALDGEPLWAAIRVLSLMAVFILLIMVPYRLYVAPTVDPVLRAGFIALRNRLGRDSNKT
jgi:hypothetical protein